MEIKACFHEWYVNQVSSTLEDMGDDGAADVVNVNLFTTIHDGNFRRYSSMNVTIK